MSVPGKRASPLVLAAAAVLLFLVWSNSFVAAGFVLGEDLGSARLDWLDLTVARFLVAGPLCGAFLALGARREAVQLVLRHPMRLLACAILGGPVYHFALYYGQQHGVPAPVASLTTALAPLFMLLLAAAILGEKLTGRRILGFSIAVAGMVLISSAKGGGGGLGYPGLIAVTALAPLCWSIYSILTKPLASRGRPVLWSYLTAAAGFLLVLPWLPAAAPRLRQLDLWGWLAVLYLAVPCTVGGFALWNWLLRHLPASTVGLTVFLNPPLTAVSKLVLAVLFPSTFLFAVQPREWVGGGVVIFGLAVALGVLRR